MIDSWSGPVRTRRRSIGRTARTGPETPDWDVVIAEVENATVE